MNKTKWNIFKFHLSHILCNLLKKKTLQDYIYKDSWRIGVVIGSRVSLEGCRIAHAIAFKDIEGKEWDNFVRFVNCHKHIEAYIYCDDLHDDNCKLLNKACEKVEDAAKVLTKYFFKPIKIMVKSMYSSKILIEEFYENNK